MIMNPLANTGDTRDRGLTSGLERSLRKGNGNPLQHSCLENPIDSGVGRLQSMGSQRVGHNWELKHTHTHTHTDIWPHMILTSSEPTAATRGRGPQSVDPLGSVLFPCGASVFCSTKKALGRENLLYILFFKWLVWLSRAIIIKVDYD